MNRPELEKYHGSGSRHNCPACGRGKKFTRYIDTETGRYIADNVGRCDRETSCGYHYTPKQYQADNPGASNVRKMSVFERVSLPGLNGKNGLERCYEGRLQPKKPDYLKKAHLLETFTDYDQNAFVQFLLGLFPYTSEDVNHAVKDYRIGTKDGYTCFPIISKSGYVCKAKLMKFDPATGKRLKEDYSISSLQSKLIKAGDLKEDFETDKDVFFGEHLLPKYDGLPIAIVEAEKSAVIASICNGVFPDMVWLASGSKQWLKRERLARLGCDRTIILYPDADAFELWQSIASQARAIGLTVNVSNLIEKRATDAEKANGSDLADYLICDQTAINEHNGQTHGDLETIRQERIAIMMFDGGLTEEQAEAEIVDSGIYQDAIRSVRRSGASEKV